MHPSENLVSFLTVEFLLTKLQPALQQPTFWPALSIHHARKLGKILGTLAHSTGASGWLLLPAGPPRKSRGITPGNLRNCKNCIIGSWSEVS